MEQKAFHFESEKVSGGKTGGHFCGVFTKSLEVDGAPGLLAACIDMQGEGELSANSHQLFEKVSEKLENGQEGILERFHVLGEEGCSFVFCFFYKGACYVFRAGDRVRLVVFEPGKSEEISITSGSGPIENGQIYLLGNDVCFDLFDFDVLKTDEYNLADIVDGIATEISAEGGKALGAILVKASGQETSAEGGEEVAGKESIGGQPIEVLEDSVEVKDQGGPESMNQNEAEGDESGHDREEPGGVGKRRLGLLGIIGKVISELTGVLKGEKRAIGSFRKKLIIGIVLLLIILVASGSFTLINRNKAKKGEQYEQFITQANSKYQEAMAIMELNKEKARGLLVEAGEDVKKAREYKDDEQAQKLLSDIESKIKETEAGNVEVGTFGEIEGDAVGLGFAGKNLIVVGEDAVWSLDSTGKASKQSDGLKNAYAGTVFDNKAFYLDEAGVFRSEGNTAGKKIHSESGYLDAGVFFGNVYLLTREQISKVVPVEGGYAEPVDYLDGKQEFGQDSRMAIDSMIWVTSGDKVLKFNRGKKESFQISGAPGKLGQLSLIYTDGTLSNLYVLDKENSALLVFDKDGVYKKALQNGQFKNASDLAVNEAEDTVYFASGNKVLKASLK